MSGWRIRRLRAALLLALPCFLALAGYEGRAEGAEARVFFIEPKDGAVVKGAGHHPPTGWRVASAYVLCQVSINDTQVKRIIKRRDGTCIAQWINTSTGELVRYEKIPCKSDQDQKKSCSFAR